MDILLIGGTGNISLSVTKQLLERGDREQLVEKLTASARRKRKMNLE